MPTKTKKQMNPVQECPACHQHTFQELCPRCGSRIAKSFAQTLLDWRRKRKLNRAEACRLFNVPYRTWQDWEAEIHIPGVIVQGAIQAQIKTFPHGTEAKNLAQD